MFALLLTSSVDEMTSSSSFGSGKIMRWILFFAAEKHSTQWDMIDQASYLEHTRS